MCWSRWDPYGIMAELVATAMTTPMTTYENAPVYTLIEEELFRATRARIGYPGAIGDGMLCPGGSISIISAIHVAKVFKYPEVRTKGLAIDTPKRLTGYISRNAHYSFNKGFNLQGHFTVIVLWIMLWYGDSIVLFSPFGLFRFKTLLIRLCQHFFSCDAYCLKLIYWTPSAELYSFCGFVAYLCMTIVILKNYCSYIFTINSTLK